jgi:membrane associated rhomboid family serine protease
MGIYDREYYRDESGGGGWFSGSSPATRTFIAINVVLWVMQWLGQSYDLTALCAANGDLIFRHFQVHRLFTAMFVQLPGSPIWFALQMYFLYLIGAEMEGIYGSREFTCNYLAAGALSTLAWSIVDATRGAGQIYCGPEAPILALLVLFTLYYPHREVLLMFVLPVRMWMLLALVLGVNLVNALQAMRVGGGAIPQGGGGFVALLAAAGYGWAYKALDFRWTRLLRLPWRGRRAFRVVSPEPRERVRSARPGPAAGAGATPPRPSFLPEEQIEERVDEILAKIAREGRGALTDEEKRILEEASLRARNRRSERLH